MGELMAGAGMSAMGVGRGSFGWETEGGGGMNARANMFGRFGCLVGTLWGMVYVAFGLGRGIVGLGSLWRFHNGPRQLLWGSGHRRKRSIHPGDHVGRWNILPNLDLRKGKPNRLLCRFRIWRRRDYGLFRKFGAPRRRRIANFL